MIEVPLNKNIENGVTIDHDAPLSNKVETNSTEKFVDESVNRVKNNALDEITNDFRMS